MKHRLKPVFFSVTLVFASLLAGGLIAELALRGLGVSFASFHRPDDRLGLRLRENAQGQFTSEGFAQVRINSAGFRDRERIQQKPPGSFRIAILGDSNVEALQVDYKDTFSALLERHLTGCLSLAGRPIEVLNFGVSSYGTAQQLLTFRHVARAYSPDLVVSAGFMGNDIRNNSQELETDKVRPFFVVNGDGLAEDNSFANSAEFKRRTGRLRVFLDKLRVLRVVQLAYHFKDRVELIAGASALKPADAVKSTDSDAFEVGLDDEVYSEPKSKAWLDAWVVTERILEAMSKEVAAANAKLLIMTLSTGIQVHPDPALRRRFFDARGHGDEFYPDRRIETIASKLNVDSLSLAPQIQRIAEREKTFFHGFSNTRLGTGHLNQAGHRVVAEITAEKICRGQTIPGS